jgi:serine/threonine-protein phosphatase 2A activator
MALNEAVKGKSLSVECPESDVIKGMVSLLDKLDVWIEETPPIEQPQRFGNQAFRTWYKKVKEVLFFVCCVRNSLEFLLCKVTQK